MNKIKYFKIIDGVYKQGILESRKMCSKVISATQNCELLGANQINISFQSSKNFFFDIGDKIHTFGQDFYLNQLPTASKSSDGLYNYNLCFESVACELLKVLFLNPYQTTGEQNQVYNNLQTDFHLTGNISIFLNLLKTNIARVYPENMWEIDGCMEIDGDKNERAFDFEATDAKTLTFSSENCLGVLQRLAQEYDIEFSIQQISSLKRLIKVGKQGKVHENKIFKMGRGKGLYSLSRQKLNEKELITRLFVFGSEQNLGPKYKNGAKRLSLPKDVSLEGLNIDDRNSIIEDPEKISKIGLSEASLVFDDIKPTREGSVSEITPSEFLRFKDTSMPFNLNQKDSQGSTIYMLNGVSPKIHFNTGNLAGYCFEITNYNDTKKEFALKQIEIEGTEGGILIPSKQYDAFKIKQGDKYVILDISLPQQYIDSAERKLLEKAKDKFNELSNLQVQYSLEVDEKFLEKTDAYNVNDNIFNAGDYIKIEDEDLINRIDIKLENGEDDKNYIIVRVLNFTRDVLNPFKYTLTLGNIAQRTIIQKLIEAKQNTDRIHSINKLNDPQRARANWRTLEELRGLVFDNENYFNPEKIKPLSIETNMLSIGSRASQFTLSVTFDPNYGGQNNQISHSEGNLTHYAIEDKIRNWKIQSGVRKQLENNAYYIYAKCSRSSDLDAQIEILTDQLQVDYIADYYYFLIGVVHSLDACEGELGEKVTRTISLTYGNSKINGSFINTGRITSNNNNTYFDLDTGEIGGKIVFKDGKTLEEKLDEAFPNPNLLMQSQGIFEESRVNMWTKYWDLYNTICGKTVTISADMKHEGEPDSYAALVISSMDWIFVKYVHVYGKQSEWKRYNFTCDIPNDGKNYRVEIDNMGNGKSYWKNVKTEISDKATAWVAHKDEAEFNMGFSQAMLEKASQGSTTIIGGYVGSDILTAKKIFSDNVAAQEVIVAEQSKQSDGSIQIIKDNSITLGEKQGNKKDYAMRIFNAKQEVITISNQPLDFSNSSAGLNETLKRVSVNSNGYFSIPVSTNNTFYVEKDVSVKIPALRLDLSTSINPQLDAWGMYSANVNAYVNINGVTDPSVNINLLSGQLSDFIAQNPDEYQGSNSQNQSFSYPFSNIFLKKGTYKIVLEGSISVSKPAILSGYDVSQAWAEFNVVNDSDNKIQAVYPNRYIQIKSNGISLEESSNKYIRMRNDGAGRNFEIKNGNAIFGFSNEGVFTPHVFNDLGIDDLNNLRISGVFLAENPPMRNMPTSSFWFYVEVTRYSDDWVLQKAFDFFNDAYYIRRKSFGNWGNWRRISLI